jgi:hypothetical protein
MGFVRRKKNGNLKFNGSKLNVPGQGISTTKISPPDKIQFSDNNPPQLQNTRANTN